LGGRVGRRQVEVREPIDRELRAGGVDVPDRGAAVQAGLGDPGGEAAGGGVGDVADVVDGGHGAAAGDDHVHGPGSAPGLALAAWLDRIDNTVQYSWLLAIARTFHDLPADARIGPDTIDGLYDRADHARDGAAWDRRVWEKSRLEAVFLTNEFDDSLEGWDTA